MKDIKVTKAADLDGLEGIYLVVESGEELDAADIRYCYDGQEITLRKVE